MKLSLVLILFLAFVSDSSGQRPSPSATPSQSRSPQTSRTTNFGSSLKNYENDKKKQKKDPQIIPKNTEIVDDETIRVKTDLVVSDILVTDQRSNVIVNLKREDFVVLEDGVPQTIEVFSRGEGATIPRSIVLIIDWTSVQAPYIRNSFNAARILVDKLNPNDQMALVTADLKLRLDFTQDKVLINKTLASLEKEVLEGAGGGDFATLLAVLNELFSEENRQRIIIFQADGVGAMWLKQDKEHPYPVSYSTRYNSGMRYTGEKTMHKYGFGEVKEAVERSQATIYSVIPGISFLGFSEKERLARARITLADLYTSNGWDLPITIESQYTEAERKTAGQTAMFKVAGLSGGNAGFIEKPEDAENIYSEIFTVVKNRYVIGYYPTNQKQDGRRREVKIEVRNRPDYIVTGRKGYLPK